MFLKFFDANIHDFSLISKSFPLFLHYLYLRLLSYSYSFSPVLTQHFLLACMFIYLVVSSKSYFLFIFFTYL